MRLSAKVLLEAAATGRPIVATDVPGCREIVKNNINGYLVTVKDPLELSNKIIQIILDKKLSNEMGMTGRKIVEEEFSIGKVNSETIAVYKQAV